MRAHHRRTPRGPACRRRAGRDQPRRHQGRDARGLLLRPGPVEPADLLDRRQRRGELRRRALPEVRLHHQPRRSAPTSSPPQGDTVPLGGARPDSPGLRPARRRRRVRGHSRHRHLGDRPAGPAARGGAHDPRRVRVHRPGRRRDVGDHRRRHRAGGHRDDGRARDRGGRGGRAVQLPRRRGSGAGDRARRSRDRGRAGVRRRRAAVQRERRLRAAARHRPDRTGADLARAASRRSPRWAGSARTTSSRTA